MQKCAFCCQPPPKSQIKALRKLMKKNNPDAFFIMAERYKSGDGVLQSDTRSFEMYIRASELGDAKSYSVIGNHYRFGTLVEEDEAKASTYEEIAAKKGSLAAHRYLVELHGRSSQKGVEHLKVGACAGDKKSMSELTEAYRQTSLVSKEELTQTLRAYQASSNEMRSEDYRDDEIEFQMG